MPDAVIDIARYTVLFTAILVAAGGIMGYVKAKSTASLISGCVSGLILGASFALSFSQPSLALALSLGVMFFLEFVFALRFSKTKKFMPAGMMLVVVGVAQLPVVLGVLKAYGIV